MSGGPLGSGGQCLADHLRAGASVWWTTQELHLFAFMTFVCKATSFVHFLQTLTNVSPTSVRTERRAATVLVAILALVLRVSRIETAPQVSILFVNNTCVKERRSGKTPYVQYP